VYRYYGSTKGQTRIATEGGGKTLACLASRGQDRCEILLGSVGKNPTTVVLELHGLGTGQYQATIRTFASQDLDRPLPEAELPPARPAALENQAGGLRLKLEGVEENQAFSIVLRPASK
jgi:hypothetical protein